MSGAQRTPPLRGRRRGSQERLWCASARIIRPQQKKGPTTEAAGLGRLNDRAVHLDRQEQRRDDGGDGQESAGNPEQFYTEVLIQCALRVSRIGTKAGVPRGRSSRDSRMF